MPLSQSTLLSCACALLVASCLRTTQVRVARVSTDVASVQANGPAPAAFNAVGVWLFDQPTHGEHEAVEYSFFPGGQIARFAVRGEDVGLVARGSVTCHIEGTWRPGTGTTVVIDAGCTDNIRRDVVLDLGNASIAGRGRVTIVRVGTETDWTHPGWPWRALRCSSTPGLRCADDVDRVEPPATARQDSAADLEQLATACTAPRSQTLVPSCVMLAQAIRHDDARTLLALAPMAVTLGDGTSPAPRVLQPAEFAEAVRAAGGVRALFRLSDFTPRIVHDCLQCARSMAMMDLAQTDLTWAVALEGLNRISALRIVSRR